MVLKDIIQVTSLKEGAELYGGATQVGDVVFSFTTIMDRVEIKEQGLNQVQLFIPKAESILMPKAEHDIVVMEILKNIIQITNLDEDGLDKVRITPIKGSWKCHKTEDILYNDLKVICLETDLDGVKALIEFSRVLKKDLKQEVFFMVINNQAVLI